MTTRTGTRTIRGRATLLAALGVASLALVAATPASAINRSYEPADGDAPVIERAVDNTNKTPPVDENGKKSCEIANINGGTSYLPHGTTITVTWPNGTSKTVKCDDGDWVAQLLQVGDYHYEANEASVDPSGALVLVNAH